MRLSLSQKLTLAPLLVALFFTVLFFGYLIPRVSSAFEAQGRDVGGALPAALAATLPAAMPGGQTEALQAVLEQAVRHHQVAYVAVFDGTGQLRAVAGEYATAMRELRDRLARAQGEATFYVRDAELLDVSSRFANGAGTVHVGFNRTSARAQVRAITTGVSVVMVLALALFVVVGIVLARRVAAPLVQLTAAAQRIAEHGDLRETVRVEGSDEVAQLSKAFSLMVSKVKDLLQQLQGSSDLLRGSVDHLNDSAGRQNEMVSRHAAALQETQVTAQEIRQTSVVASRAAETVIDVAERAEVLGKTGEIAITESIEGMVALRAQVEQIAERIMALGERTEQISGITETVKDLADQSHLLAVNAAIEAARSGEHGKGFAVVAREIRGLADQSIRATNQVRGILADISTAIFATVEITAAGTQRMETGLAQVRTSGDTLRQLSSIVRDSVVSARQISQTVNQQATGIEQIFTAVNELNTVMGDTVKRIATTSESAVSLKLLSERVAAMVRDYRL
ncbi:methyl-accepting chemotaxis protein [Corallococcus sp. AB030]|uniref:methyl-accepting chemotaxis protein n=1 Tax=Corallococcus sp. AB030 TaxID=2316716 RepID=UPI000EDEA39E|nr:methyl-accepting chemotaxis protein [Corallococcus sp. AB030]RKI06442.1 methyl-accepting chemotaxis protein [Corallococcus sp. AB030]